MNPLVGTGVFELLTPEERGRREELVETIVVGEVVSLRAGKALREVRDRRLYRETHTSLEAWALEMCRVKRSRVYLLIEFAVVQEAAAEQGIEVSNERMARALGMVPAADYQLIVDVTRATTGRANPSSADIQGVADANRMRVEGMAVEHPQTGEPIKYADLPPAQRAPALATAVQRGSQDRRDFQGTDDQKPMDYIAGLQQMGTAGALRFDRAGYWLEVMDASTGELLDGPKVKSIWDAPRAWRKKHESELQSSVERGAE